MPNNVDVISKIQQAKLYFANLMDEYVDSFVFSIDRNEGLSDKVNYLYSLIEAIEYQIRKGYYYDNEITKELYEKIDCITPIYNTDIVIDYTLIQPFISNGTSILVFWGSIEGDINNQSDLIALFGLKQNKITLTTTGTSGAATFNQETGALNIPEYQGGVTSFNTRTGAITLEDTDVTDALGFTPEDVANKSTNVNLGTSDTLYPSQKAVKEYVDAQVAGATIPDATTTVKGKLKLAGDLSGTADAPTVPALANKEPLITAGTTSQYWRGDKTFQTLDKNAVGLGNVNNTSDADKPISDDTQTALDLKQDKLDLTVNYIPVATATDELGDSPLFVDGGKVGLNTETPEYDFDIDGTARIVTTPTITTATKALVKDPVTGQISEQEFSGGAGSSVLTEEFNYSSSQTFTTSQNISNILSLAVNGQQLSTTQYTKTTNTFTILDPLEAGDYVNIIYVNIPSGVIDYYTQAQVNTLLARDWMSLARGYSSIPTELSNVGGVLIFEYKYNSDTVTLYRRIASGGLDDTFNTGFSGGIVSGLVATKKITYI